MTCTRLVWILVPLIVALAPIPALAAWSHDPGAQLPVCTAARQQQYVDGCSDDAGGALFAWEDHRDSLTLGVKVYMQHLTGDGGLCPGWPVNGLAVCTATGNQTVPAMTADGSGGAFVSWQDSRVPVQAIYVQHILAGGTIAPGWPATGVAVSGTANLKGYAPVIGDGGSGVIVAWRDDRDSLTSGPDIYMQHVLGTGVADPAWPSNGRAVCTANGVQNVGAGLVSDGAGGALVSWQDDRNSLTTVRDIYASHVLANGTIDPAVPLNGTPVCVTFGAQEANRMASDGAGGAYVVWWDLRNGANWLTYMHHLRPNGTVDPVWPVNGLAVCNVANSYQELPLVVGDGASGAITAWIDNRAVPGTYAQHVLVNGTLDAGWPATGVLLSSAAGQSLDGLIADGQGGAIASWQFYPAPSLTPVNEYVSHLLSTGVLDPAWPAIGRQLSSVPLDPNQIFSALVSDGAGGAIVAWHNLVGVLPFSDDIYAGRVAFNGLLAPEPAIASVRDVPADQGGHVMVRWNPSWLDTFPTYPIASYDLWRRLSGPAAQRALVAGLRVQAEGIRGLDVPRSGSLRMTLDAGVSTYWEYIVSVPARGLSGYAYDAATSADSVAAGIPWNDFMVDARSTTGSYQYSSAVDSGYSVDNLPPAVPAPFTGVYASGAAHLEWGPNNEPDFWCYKVYRGGSAGFAPSPATLIATKSDPDYVDPGPAGSYYKLSALDIHGNESGFALLTPTSTSGVGAGPIPRVLALAEPRPNPAQDGALLSFALPSAGSMTLAVYDIGGRRVRTISAGRLEAREYALPFDLRDDEGQRVPSGLYFVRLDAGGQTLVRRLAIVE